MPVESLGNIGHLQRLTPLATPRPSALDATPGATGFASVLGEVIDSNRRAASAADQALNDLAVGDAQDLHTLTLATAEADMTFRLILELRNRISDALQEVTRMQV